MPPPISSPALLCYAFVALDGPDRSVAVGWRALTAVWQACRRFGTTEPTLGTAGTPPPIPPTARDALVVLAAARRPGTGPLRSVFLWAEHGTAGIVAALSADPDDQPGWAGMAQRWQDALPADPDGLLSRTTLLLGYAPDVANVRATGTAVLGLAGASLVADAGPAGALLWELPGSTDQHRRIAIVAPANREDRIDQWVWASEGRSGLMPLTRYFLNLARARYEVRVHAALRPVAELVADTDRTITTLLNQLLPDQSRADAARLLAADAGLQRTQVHDSGVLWRLTRIQEMAITVRALQQNVRRHRPPGPPVDGGMFNRDEEALTWQLDLLDREIAYLQALTQRAATVHTTASTAVSIALGRRRERITLLQTSFVAALLMALTAIQAFQYVVPMDHGLTAPVIDALAAAAFGLPFLTARWSGLIPHTDPYRWPDLAAAVWFGGSLGWLASSLGWLLAAHRTAPLWSTAPAVILLAVALSIPTWRS